MSTVNLFLNPSISTLSELIENMMKGDRRSFSRILSILEKADSRAFEILEKIWDLKKTNSYSVGITGPAGAGKSTIIDQSISHLREKNKKVGVIAVDPSSPFSGGAVLGDRIRMQRHSGDENVFIRSVGTKGQTGGISYSTRAHLNLYHAYGIEEVVVETVGAGQSETSIFNLVDTTVVILVPESGDSIQALKAGILEIADIFVVNKMDRGGAERVLSDLKTMLSLNPSISSDSWEPRILQTEAVSGQGIEELWDAISAHREHLENQHLDPQKLFQNRLRELRELLEVRLKNLLKKKALEDPKIVEKLSGEPDPNLYAITEALLKEVKL